MDEYLDVPDFLRNKENLAEKKESGATSNDLSCTGINIYQNPNKVDIKCIYVSEDIYRKMITLGLEELAYIKPLEKYNAWFSKGADCWIDPEVFKKNYGIGVLGA